MVNHLTSMVLEKASDRVADIQGDEDDDEVEDNATAPDTSEESRKER